MKDLRDISIVISYATRIRIRVSVSEGYGYADTVEQSKYSGLNEQLTEASRGLRQMRGEELEGLSVEELHQMERKLEAGLHRVLSTKDQLFMQQISELQQKGAQLEDENRLLKKQVPHVITAGAAVVAADTENVLTEDGQSSESVMTALHSGSSHDNDDGSDISLKLSLP
ncbi:hypothetical protein PVAP13_4NG131700 [Panicum virgatum]|uniref:K-box domain-containing protein n=1 Tax=Panicum virgatum TaxID=38727 RepID=A0A8T0T194_PANVG|nr:hypothetical protein PVAP13_4NG131700 [Panicum virgatum]